MTENENKAIKWIKNIREDAVVILDHIEKSEPNVSPLLYAGRKEKAETIIKSFEELEKYRAAGTVEECQAAMEMQKQRNPDIWGDSYDNEGNIIYDMYDCPNCGKSYEVDYHDYKFCPECGQAIDRRNIP